MRPDRTSIRKGYDRVRFYVTNFVQYYMPDALYRALYVSTRQLTTAEQRRVEYYIHLPQGAEIGCDGTGESYNTMIRPKDGTFVKTATVGTFKYPFGQRHKFATYFFDLFPVVRCFAPAARFNYVFGDIDFEPASPTFVKSRPIGQGASNSVLCKLNSVRHFRFITDRIPFSQKRDMLVFRNNVEQQPWRTRFLEMYADHPLCDVGMTNHSGDARLHKPFMSIGQQLQYKFIACIEGHDVATNLKWVMSSNSVAVMPRPRIESWFMEGLLVGGVHYIEIKSDYSDLPEKLAHYIAHPEEAERIIQNAHEWVAQFADKRAERRIQREVARRYFNATGQ